MKIRSGFVSNSSSSSFVLIVKSKTSCPTCGYSVVDYLNLLPETPYYSDNSYIKSNSATEIEKYFRAEFSYFDDEEIKECEEMFQKLHTAEAAGHAVYHLNLSNNDEFAYQFIQKDKHIEIVRGDL